MNFAKEFLFESMAFVWKKVVTDANKEFIDAHNRLHNYCADNALTTL